MLLLVLSSLFSLSSLPAQTYWINTVAGSFDRGDDGPAAKALLESVTGITFDPAGRLYLAANRGSIRRVGLDGIISTVSGSTGATAIAFHPSGNLYIAESYRIRSLSPTGTFATIAGTGAFGFSGDNGPAIRATFGYITSMVIDADGNVYVSDNSTYRIRKIGRDGTVTTVAGTGVRGFTGDNGAATQARISPNTLAITRRGEILIGDSFYHRIRKIDANGIITTIAGNGLYQAPTAGIAATSSSLRSPNAMTAAPNGTVYFADPLQDRVYAIDGNGFISNVAGTTQYGFSGDGGLASAAQFSSIEALAADAQNNVYIWDAGNTRVRRVTPSGIVTTVAGTSQYTGDNGPALSAVFNLPGHVALHRNGDLYVSDTQNHAIRRITPSGTVTTVAGTGIRGFAGDNGPATQARLNGPQQMAFDSNDNLYFADSFNNRIRRVTPGGVVSTVAGNGGFPPNPVPASGPATSVGLAFPFGLAIDTQGALYVSESNGYRIRRISGGVTSTFAGTGTLGYAGDGGNALEAQFRSPQTLAFDNAGNLLVADMSNQRVRKITSGGVISTLIGNGSFGPGQDGAPAISALSSPSGIAVDRAGNVFLSQGNYGYIYQLTAEGILRRIAGNNRFDDRSDNLPALRAGLYSPTGMAIDAAGNLIFSDTYHHLIRKLTPIVPGKIEILSGNNQSGSTGRLLDQALLVKVTSANNLPVAGFAVQFKLESGQATLSATSANTNESGVAGIGVTLGETAGEIAISATVSTLPAVRFQLTATATTGPAGPIEPRIAPLRGVVTAGPSGFPALSPNAIIRITGTGFAAASTNWAASSGDLPAMAESTCVEVGGARAFLRSVTPNAIEAVVPEVPLGEAQPVSVLTSCDSATPLRSNPVQLPVLPATPELLGTAGTGETYAIDLVQPASGEKLAAAIAGETVRIFAIGLGTSPLPVGQAAVEATPVTQPLTLSIANQTISPSEITAALVPGLVAVYQLDFTVPGDIAAGEAAIILRAAGVNSPPSAVLTIAQ